ncbi:hypothetical protein [Bradyrhizobium sp. STM 3562]|uniref:hypothetical protein n=1 Tax=Bradyrhizobium sp. STM 3562 TaxID=578924 RepID=UPI00388D88B9
MSDDDIFERYSRDAQPTAEAAATDSADPDALFDKYARSEPKEEKKARLYVSPARSRVDVVNASGFNNRMVSSMPIIGPLFDKATAAAGAAVQPLVSSAAAKKTFGERYRENLAYQDEQNLLYGEQHPIASTAADVTGGAIALGPLSGGPMSIAATRAVPAAPSLVTNVGQRILGMRGNSLGARVYQGIGGAGAIETTNQLLKGNNPTDQGIFGPVPLAMAGGALGPMVGEAISAGGNRLLEWMPRQTGEMAGVNSVGRNMLVNAVEGETPQSLAETRARYGRAGMLADINDATTDIAGALADIPGPHKGFVREAYRDRARGQADRILQSLDRNTVPHVDIADLTNSIENARGTAADPLYDRFRTMQVEPTPELKALIPRLENAGAFDLAEELSGISGRPFNKNYFTPGKEKSYPTAEGWDYVKRGLDRRIASAQDGGDKELYRELVNLKREMLSEIDKTPAGQVWAQARETFAEHSELLHQIEEGQKTFARNTRKDDLARELNGLSGPELSARVQGARDAIQQIMENSVRGDTTARNTLLTRANRDKLELLFGKERANRLIQDLQAEVNVSKKTENVIGGTQTTPKKERVNAISPQPSELGYLSNLDLTKPASFIPEWMKPQTILEGAKAQRYADAYQQIAPLITRRMDDPQFAALIRDLMNEQANRAGRVNRLNQIGRGVTGLASSTLPQLGKRLLEPAAAR